LKDKEEELKFSIYKCESCGAYNTTRQTGNDNPKQCYYCGGFDLNPLGEDENKEMLED
jgi:hypothetical protein